MDFRLVSMVSDGQILKHNMNNLQYKPFEIYQDADGNYWVDIYITNPQTYDVYVKLHHAQLRGDGVPAKKLAILDLLGTDGERILFSINLKAEETIQLRASLNHIERVIDYDHIYVEFAYSMTGEFLV